MTSAGTKIASIVCNRCHLCSEKKKVVKGQRIDFSSVADCSGNRKLTRETQHIMLAVRTCFTTKDLPRCYSELCSYCDP